MRLRFDVQENRESLKVRGPMNCGVRMSEDE